MYRHRAPFTVARHRSAVRAALSFLILFGLAGCGSPTMEVQVVRYPEAIAVTARTSGCEVALLDEGHVLPSGCCELGDVFVGDTGWTSPCDRDRVEKELRKQACTIGGDTVVIRPVKDWQSSCFQVRARVLRCPPPTTAEPD